MRNSYQRPAITAMGDIHKITQWKAANSYDYGNYNKGEPPPPPPSGS